jgi:hypothetical protein
VDRPGCVDVCAIADQEIDDEVVPARGGSVEGKYAVEDGDVYWTRLMLQVAAEWSS